MSEPRTDSTDQVTYCCGTCGKPIKTGCYCAECAEFDADEELGCADLEDRLDAAFERIDRG